MAQPNRHLSQEGALPRQLTAFVGRHEELSEIKGLLLDSSCRLLTLVGVGGTGKTRLAVEAAAGLEHHFPDGLYFVPLQALESPEFLASTVAGGLGVTLSSHDEPEEQLLNYLRDRNLLLILDNVEHLADDLQVLTDILRIAPAVKLLTTSREVLYLQEEWLYPVEGLAVPAEGQVEGWEGYDAVQLFVERVHHIRRDLSLKAETESIIRICRLVEGMPLALELAASWTKTLTCAQVADEIQRSLDFLSTRLRNVPARHRSMRAVFDHAWQRLAPEEQSVFARLSIFRGGFDQTAAEVVAEASLSLLAGLVDKSLLRWEPDGRYHIHELLRQFGQEQLAQSPEALACAQDLHATYYTRFLGDRFEDLTGESQRAALKEIEVELGNVRAAWQWAVSRRGFAELESAAMGLHTFFQYKGHFLEGVEAFAAAIAAAEEASPSPNRDRALAAILNCAGWFEMRFGRVQEAVQMQERALSLYDAHNLLPATGQGTDPLTALTLLAETHGDYERALSLGQRAWERAAARLDRKNMAFAGYGLAGAALAQGDYEAALKYAQEVLALTEAAGNRWFMAYVYNHLGQINQVLGDLAAASRYYQASYTTKEALDDPEGMALALTYLGEIALAQHKYTRAHDLYRQSLEIYQKIGDRGGLVRACHGLGMAAYPLGNEQEAREYLQRALRVASEAGLTPLLLSVLVGIGAYLVESGARERGAALLLFIRQHPTGDQMTRDKVEHLLDLHQIECSPGGVPHVEALDQLVISLLAELAQPVAPAEELPAPVSLSESSNQALIEPLSERELEVLGLMADGLTNRQIAERLSVVVGTIKAHTSNIYGKLGVSNRTQAVIRARELNLL